MKSFLVSLILTLALAASLAVLYDHFHPRTDPAIERMEQRQKALKKALSPLLASTGEHEQEDGTSNLKSYAKLSQRLTDLEGMVFDAERNLRGDLKGLYEKLLARMDALELKLKAGGASGDEGKMTAKKLAALGIKVTPEEGLAEISGTVAHPSKSLELLAVGPGGRAHEALLMVEARPSALKSALQLLGVKQAPPPDPQSGRWKKDLGGVYIYVLWKGQKKPRRAEDMILDAKTQETMQRTRWIFTGSHWFTDTRTWDRHFAADLYKNIIAITTNYAREAVLACPLPDAVNQQIWFPSEFSCPPPQTRVRIFFSVKKRPLWDKI